MIFKILDNFGFMVAICFLTGTYIANGCRKIEVIHTISTSDGTSTLGVHCEAYPAAKRNVIFKFRARLHINIKILCFPF